jgi:hypothetical protein
MSDFDAPATTGNPESAAWFRAELEALGMTQTGSAKWLKKRGENERPRTTQKGRPASYEERPHPVSGIALRGVC